MFYGGKITYTSSLSFKPVVMSMVRYRLDLQRKRQQLQHSLLRLMIPTQCCTIALSVNCGTKTISLPGFGPSHQRHSGQIWQARRQDGISEYARERCGEIICLKFNQGCWGFKLRSQACSMFPNIKMSSFFNQFSWTYIACAVEVHSQAAKALMRLWYRLQVWQWTSPLLMYCCGWTTHGKR